jgi:hypothetical protein
MTQTDGGYEMKAATREELEAKATSTNRIVVYPESNQIFIDIDNADAYETFLTLHDILRKHPSYGSATFRNSRTLGHKHITVSFKTPLEPWQRIALQAALGSDRKRELLACLQGNPGPTVFFEDMTDG